MKMNLFTKRAYYLLVMMLFIAHTNWAQNVNVVVSPQTKKYIGGISTLERNKYISNHAGGNDSDMQAFYNDYNVSNLGRAFNGPGANAYKLAGEAGVYPPLTPLPGDTTPLPVRDCVRSDHPYKIYKQGIDLDSLANWSVNYFVNVADENSRPKYYEAINEPLVHASEYKTPENGNIGLIKDEMSRLYAAIGKKIHETPQLQNIKVFGYAAAYPVMVSPNGGFGIWNTNFKRFLDIAGDEMDGISLHIYDGKNVVGPNQKKSGSNAMAILDLLETYSFRRWGYVKPFLISEFGQIVKGSYSDINSVQKLRGVNGLIFDFMDRTDVIERAIPFISNKATWHIKAANNYEPFKGALLTPIPQGVPLSEVTGWKYSSLIYFYDLWKEVKGDRVQITSDNLDIQVQAFANGNELYLALNNLDENAQTIDLDLLGDLPGVMSVDKKSLIIYKDQSPSFTTTTFSNAPGSFTLAVDETVVLKYTFDNALVPNKDLHRTSYHSNIFLKDITANTPIVANFNNVETAFEGNAILKLSIARDNALSKSPTILVNGQAVPVPSNWRGYDQNNRTWFFGTLEVPVPISYIKPNNTISISFSDDGGNVSSVILVTETTPFDIGSTMSFEAEDATLSGTARVGACDASSQGELVKAINSGSANTVLFDMTTPQSGTYELALNYFNVNNKNMTLEVNGAGQQITLPASGSWCNKAEHPGISKLNIQLQAGDNTIKVYNCGILDKIDLTLLAVTDPGARIASSTLAMEGEKTPGLNSLFEVYPNPSHGNIKVFIPATDNVQSAELRAYNYQGKEIKKFTNLPVGKEVSLDLGKLKSGIYILKVMTNTNSSGQTKKIVIH